MPSFLVCSTAIPYGGSVRGFVVSVGCANGRKALKGAQHVASEIQMSVSPSFSHCLDGRCGCFDIVYSENPAEVVNRAVLVQACRRVFLSVCVEETPGEAGLLGMCIWDP